MFSSPHHYLEPTDASVTSASTSILPTMPTSTHNPSLHNSTTTTNPTTVTAPFPTLNVQTVVLGDILFKTWYPSFYPEELVGRTTDRLYVCRWCFRYSRELLPFLGHAVGGVLVLGLFGLGVWELEIGVRLG